MIKIKVGDWVTSYSKGIFRVERIITQYYEEHDIDDGENKKTGDEYRDKFVISKRLLNSSFKKSLGHDSCSSFFIAPLDKLELKTLNELLKKNPNWLTDLDNYQIPPIKLIYNMELKLMTKEDVKSMNEFISFIKVGRTYKEIKKEMNKRHLDKYIPATFGNYVLQMMNIDYEQKDKRKVWKDPNLLKM